MEKSLDLGIVWAVLLAGAGAAAAEAALRTEAVPYGDGKVQLEGYLAYDDAVKGPRPAVLVVHEWWGLNDYARRRTEQLAHLGYLALAADVYGKGVVARDQAEAAALAGAYKGDRSLLRQRVNSALAVLRAQPLADKRRLAAIGYCFGGTAVLEAARSGADIAGVVSFHGGLDTPHPEDARNIRAKVLVLHGADDPNVPVPQVLAFQDEMRRGKVDWQMISYGGAVHAFTNPASGSDPSRGAAYNEKADRRSWEHMRLFFAELFE
jgi:dienelactone hydrolase